MRNTVGWCNAVSAEILLPQDWQSSFGSAFPQLLPSCIEVAVESLLDVGGRKLKDLHCQKFAPHPIDCGHKRVVDLKTSFRLLHPWIVAARQSPLWLAAHVAAAASVDAVVLVGGLLAPSDSSLPGSSTAGAIWIN